MVFTDTHWRELAGRGYTVVRGAIDDAILRAAQEAGRHLNALHPEGWERSKNELWREVRYCRDPAFMTLVARVLDPLALELLDSAPPRDFVQFSSTLPGFATKGGVGRNFHIDGGKDQAIDVFNVLFGVALTRVASDTVGGFHVLPGSHDAFAEEFRRQPHETATHYGDVKMAYQKTALANDKLVVPRLEPGDIVVCHSLLAHGTSANASDVRRDMIFQRRAAAPFWDPATKADARLAFMRDPWLHFRRRP
jgi:hypothetical protein